MKNNFKMGYMEKSSIPLPLEASCIRRVRFEEVDPLGMVHHGRYPSFFEDGRVAFGDRYGLGYDAFIKNRVMAPIVRLFVNYKSPLRLDDVFEIRVRLNWCESLKLSFSYELVKKDGIICATGYTIQLLTDENGILLFAPPVFIEEFREKWKKGALI